ncbi:MAG: sigma 54-interacting transcriptional regulator [Byssovorax sp.]
MSSEQSKKKESTEPLPSELVELIRKGLAHRPRISLVIYHADGAEMVLLAPDVPVVVGRDRPSDVRISDPTLSREHARFLYAGDRIVVEDLGSTNGTWIGAQRVHTAELKVGDEILLGGLLAGIHALAPSDHNLGLESEERFRARLEEEVVRARHFQSRFTVMMVRAANARDLGVDLAEPVSTRHPGTHVGRWSPAIRALLRPVDRLALYSRDALHVLLPDCGAEAATDLGNAIASRKRVDEPPLLVGFAVYPDAATEIEKLIELSRSAAAGATAQSPVQAAPAGLWTASAPPDEGKALFAGPAMRELFETVKRIANSRIQVPVLLQGETGTGKEVLARLLHESGPRKAARMVCVNCGAIAPNLVESTLFGHEKGAFTGAVTQQKGVFEEADGGSVFLDEIGELPLSAQAALLRVLSTKRLCRVGSNREITVDVRILAATHRDLEAMSSEGTFREDLYYRMNTMTLLVPPLRDRPEEIEPLALRFLREANEANLGEVRGIERKALEMLKRYRWPGNVRELRNAIERAVVIARTELIREQDLPARVRMAAQRPARPQTISETEIDPVERPSSPLLDDERITMIPSIPPASPSSPGVSTSTAIEGDLRTKLQRYEAQLILDALRQNRWNQTEAAKQLGMPLRTLVHKIKVLEIKKLDK